MNILYLANESIMCQGVFHVLNIRFPDDEVLLFPISEVRQALLKKRYDIILIDCESIEQQPDLHEPIRPLSGVDTPILGLSANNALYNRLRIELPSFRGLINQVSNVEFFVSAITIVAAGGYCCSWDVFESDKEVYEEMYQKAGLTRREREILKLCQSGESNKAISLRLSRSEKTISAHKSNILRKLGIKGWQLKALPYNGNSCSDGG